MSSAWRTSEEAANFAAERMLSGLFIISGIALSKKPAPE
jgi:hypothetical protein